MQKQHTQLAKLVFLISTMSTQMKLLVTGSMLIDSSRIVVLPLLRISRSSSCLSCLISWAHACQALGHTSHMENQAFFR